MNKLFGLLYKELVKAGVEAQKLYEFVRRRAELQFLEEYYYLGRYGSEEFAEEDSELCIRVAEEGLRILKEVREELEG